MRVKLIVLAVGAALAVFALIWGSETVTKLSTTRARTTLSGAAGGADGANAGALASPDELPNIMKGGVGEVNKNLSELKSNLQNTMDERPARLDAQIDRAK